MRTPTTLRVAGGIGAGAAARRWLAPRDGWLTRRARDGIALMLSEVVTNAVLHGAVGPDEYVQIDVEQVGPMVTFRVYDRGEGFTPVPRDPGRARGGFGLEIVDRLAHRWGVERSNQGTCVWFEAVIDERAAAVHPEDGHRANGRGPTRPDPAEAPSDG